MKPRRITAPLGGPVVPEVKITTPGLLSERYWSEETFIEDGSKGGL